MSQGNEEQPGKTAEEAIHQQMRDTYGEYPDGRLNEDDQGAVPMMMGVQNGRVVIEFPYPVKWLGFTPETAVEIAQALVKKARAAGHTGIIQIQI